MRSRNVYVQYRVRVVTGRRLDAGGPVLGTGERLRASPIPSGAGTGRASTHRRTSDWRVPVSGRIVAAGGHLHGGAKDMWLSQPRCDGRRLVDTAPRYGMPDHLYYRARPILHEPGPIETGYFLSRQRIPVRRGETLTITGTYDNAQPHPRVMSIMHVYIAPEGRAGRRCPRLPADAARRFSRSPRPHGAAGDQGPAERPGLRTVARGSSASRHGGRASWPTAAQSGCARSRFSPPHIVSEDRHRRSSGASTTPSPHNLTFANGPA